MGKAGIMLNTTNTTFVSNRRCRKGISKVPAASSIEGNPATGKRISAITTFTAGPAMATNSSCHGFSGIFSIRAKPPIGSSVMSGVRTPKAFAISTCPNSCSSTQPNTATTKSTPSTAAAGPARSQKYIPKPANRIRKVTCTRTSVPATLPKRIAHLIPANLPPHPPHATPRNLPPISRREFSTDLVTSL